MEKYLNKNIKDLLIEFPEIATVLNGYNIGCVTCNVGTCRLKDIVEIHNLPAVEEQALMNAIAAIIYPDGAVILPQIATKTPSARVQLSFSPPVKKLVDEHTVIKRLLALIPEIIESLDLETESSRQMVLQSVDFIRSYADKYHHAKEEDVLFKYFDENLDVLKAMHLDHEAGRAYVRAVLGGVSDNDKFAVAENLNAYRELLTGHIGKEDGILYPWMDRNLSTKQVGELFARFDETDRELGNMNIKYKDLVDHLEKEIRLKGVAK